MNEAPHRTALHDRHVAAGARFTTFGGWEMPVRYGSIIDERGFAVIGGRAEVLQGFLKDRLPGTLPSLSQALSLSLAALESGSTQKLALESLEVAVLDRTRDGRKFRRIPVQDVKRLLAT